MIKLKVNNGLVGFCNYVFWVIVFWTSFILPSVVKMCWVLSGKEITWTCFIIQIIVPVEFNLWLYRTLQKHQQVLNEIPKLFK